VEFSESPSPVLGNFHFSRKKHMSTAPAIAHDPAQRQVQPQNRRASQAESSDTKTAMREEDISKLAYALWQQRGCPADSAERDWIEAEQQLARLRDSAQV
jgi:hypothetical protein